jgi:hypothetical protein
MNAETAAKLEGWYLNGESFQNKDEYLNDDPALLASFLYNGNWEILCQEADIFYD